MGNYVCSICQYVYKPEENENVDFEDVDDNYVCPICGVGKELFNKE